MTARSDLERWIATERDEYAHHPAGKWSQPAAEAAHMACVQRTGPTMWEDWAGNYIRRAVLIGLRSALGRHALGKAIVTLMHVLETATELWGPMPRPGVPTGEVHPWE